MYQKFQFFEVKKTGLFKTVFYNELMGMWSLDVFTVELNLLNGKKCGDTLDIMPRITALVYK